MTIDLPTLMLAASFVAAVSGDADALGAADSVVAARLEHMRPALGTF